MSCSPMVETSISAEESGRSEDSEEEGFEEPSGRK